ncbi:MAG TPA: respiratory nitrate reductase subunit gamma [Bacilli bacterium]
MTFWELFLWSVYPYLVLVTLTLSLIFRRRFRPFGWTSKSSEFLEKKWLQIGSPLFHYGIIFVFFGHVAGLLVPLEFYRELGVSDETYHQLALWGGGAAGLAAAAGILLLAGRRFAHPRIRATSSFGDFVTIILLNIVIFTGISATGANAASSANFDYRQNIGPWIRGVLTLRPDAAIMQDVPLPFKIHIVAAIALFAVFPFTRLVHMFSIPLSYLARTYVLYRKRHGRAPKNSRHAVSDAGNNGGGLH